MRLAARARARRRGRSGRAAFAAAPPGSYRRVVTRDHARWPATSLPAPACLTLLHRTPCLHILPVGSPPHCWPAPSSSRPRCRRRPPPPAPSPPSEAGRVVDPATGTVATNQVLLVQGGRFTAIGATVAIPAGATVIDLSALTVVPGLVDAHNHLALTYKEVPENNVYYITSCSRTRRCAPSRRRRTASRCWRPASRSCATWGTTATTPTSRCARRSSRGGCPGPTIINVRD